VASIESDATGFIEWTVARNGAPVNIAARRRLPARQERPVDKIELTALLPPDHPLRRELHEEVHARPSEALSAPLRVTYLALVSDPASREQEWQHVRALAARFGVTAHGQNPNHFSADLGPFRLKWERHSEFSRYKFIAPGATGQPFAQPAIKSVPADWLEALSGSVIVAAHADLVMAREDDAGHESLSAQVFDGNIVIGSRIADGAGEAYTDFRLYDGCSRFYLRNRSMSPRQAGRMLQRLLEIETYRMMALMALPVAQQLTPFLTGAERELSQITTLLAESTEADEPVLLDRLTRLEAGIESRESAHAYRFAAAAAYYELVQRRIDELREQRIQGLQTFREFTERRLAPAMNTCRAAAARQESLSQRVARATQLLSTRVDVTREKQNQSVLESMNRRAAAQLRLQQTVEGLSIAAITYYIVGLVGYAAKGAKSAGLALDPEIAMAVSIPLVLVLGVLAMRRVRKAIKRQGN
jgi:uncharacterized membrane-anchored protein